MSAAPLLNLTEIKTAAGRVERLRRDTANFMILAHKLEGFCGIHLTPTPKNLSLMAARVGRILMRRGIENYEEYIRLLDRGDISSIQEFISIMTTNTTEFFRETRHFEYLTKSLPRFLEEKRASGDSEIRVWCAASSSGQEVYSLIMTLVEHDPSLLERNLKVLATDIDREILEKASQGVYTDAEMQTVAPLFRQKYFSRIRKKNNAAYVINQEVRRLVRFAPFNLMTEPYPFRYGFDIIFCRNVLIYFERSVSVAVTDRLAGVLRPGGYLFVGHSEVGIVRPSLLTAETSAVYRKAKK